MNEKSDPQTPIRKAIKENSHPSNKPHRRVSFHSHRTVKKFDHEIMDQGETPQSESIPYSGSSGERSSFFGIRPATSKGFRLNPKLTTSANDQVDSSMNSSVSATIALFNRLSRGERPLQGSHNQNLNFSNEPTLELLNRIRPVSTSTPKRSNDSHTESDDHGLHYSQSANTHVLLKGFLPAASVKMEIIKDEIIDDKDDDEPTVEDNDSAMNQNCDEEFVEDNEQSSDASMNINQNPSDDRTRELLARIEPFSALVLEDFNEEMSQKSDKSLDNLNLTYTKESDHDSSDPYATKILKRADDQLTRNGNSIIQLSRTPKTNLTTMSITQGPALNLGEPSYLESFNQSSFNSTARSGIANQKCYRMSRFVNIMRQFSPDKSYLIEQLSKELQNLLIVVNDYDIDLLELDDIVPEFLIFDEPRIIPTFILMIRIALLNRDLDVCSGKEDDSADGLKSVEMQLDVIDKILAQIRDELNASSFTHARFIEKKAELLARLSIDDPDSYEACLKSIDDAYENLLKLQEEYKTRVSEVTQELKAQIADELRRETEMDRQFKLVMETLESKLP